MITVRSGYQSIILIFLIAHLNSGPEKCLVLGVVSGALNRPWPHFVNMTILR